MRKIYKLSLTVFAALTFSSQMFAQNRFFTDAGENRTVQTTGQRVIIPQKFRTSSMDVQAMKNFLWSLPSERAIIANRNLSPVIELPMPDGQMARFRIWESSIQEPALQAKFPDIRTFAGQGIDDPYASIRLDYSPDAGFHGQILSHVKGRVFIDPYARGDVSNYVSYFTKDYGTRAPFNCEVTEYAEPLPRIEAGPCRGTQLYTYRLAVANTNEYAAAVGGTTDALLHAAIVTAVNRVVGVYETELAIRMVLVANNDLVEFTTTETDPFTGNNNANTLINESQTQITSIIGTANFDIGHTFSTGAGGLAGLGVVCNASNKARGVTGLSNPVGDVFYIDFVAHEVGHQFRGNHSFNGQVGNCSGGNRNGATAYEPGSGTTIQAYAGICGSDDIQPNSDPFFHTISFDEISNFVATGGGAGCAVLTPTGNTIPVITAMDNNNVSIPVNTPFTLTGTATDGDGDPLTYCWEQWDLGPQGAWNSGATSTTAPNFKSRVPKTTGSRTFPDMAVILANFPANPAATMGGLKGETLPTVARTMKFRLTVRDNRVTGGGVTTGGDGCGTFSSMFQVNVVGTTPFAVSFPNGGESFVGGSTQTITWNNAGTNASPFNVANVRILLSTDGGLTYPTVVSASTANDGSEALSIPVVSTTTARIKIEAIGNIFFDISNANFTITPPPTGFSFGPTTPATATCPAPATMNVTLPTISNGGFTNAITLSATAGVPAGTNVTFGTNPVTPGNSSVVTLNNTNTLAAGSYVVTITGTATGAPDQTANLTFTVNPGTGPTITTQPANQTVCAGSNATFNVVATGTYQWQVSTNGGGTWTNVAGATSASYTITGATAGLSGNQYRVVVTGQCGSTNSNAATLTVNTAPAITSQPQNLTLCSGSAASFSVAATGSGLTYQWELSTDGGGTYNPISGATSATYNIASVTVGMNNNRYRCVVSGTCTPAATSSAATLLVSSSITVTTNPVSQTVCEGTNLSFTVAAGGSGLSYQWEVSTNGGTSWSNVTDGGVYSGATTTTLTITGVPPTFNTYRYRAIVSNAACTPGVSTAAILTVNTFPVITAQPQNATICEGANQSFSVTATTGVGTLSYQWQLSVNGGTTWTNLTGATTSSFAQTAIPAGQNGYRFRVIVTAGCGSVTSNAAILTVNTYPIISFTAPAVICVSDPAISLSASPAGGAFSGNGVSGTSFAPSAAGVGPRTVTYTATNAGCQSSVGRVILVNDCAERHLTLDQYPAIIVYPSPNNGRFSIRLNTDLYTKLNIKIYNSAGQLVKSQVASGLTYGSVIPLDITNQASGTYHLFLSNDENGSVSTKGVSIVVYK